MDIRFVLSFFIYCYFYQQYKKLRTQYFKDPSLYVMSLLTAATACKRESISYIFALPRVIRQIVLN